MGAAHAAPMAGRPLELWAGIECTVNRVGATYSDQLVLSGHDRRADDLDLLADLGVRALRYPVLWERTAPDGPEHADWSWPDERLGRLRALGLQPIVGLVHHGSGPAHTSLLDRSFPPGLARFAGAVAARYPWVECYTPVNEPLTTARFSGLYGHWYPHGRDDLTFARALLTECRAVVLSMRAIRAVNPRARLVQTEDLGHTLSTPALAYQAAFENERRWLTFDLLCGRVAPGHCMWDYLRRVGVDAATLDWFRANPCPPDVIGINHYLTSARFLDENLAPYPAHTHGGNGRQAYADVEAVRVCTALPGAGELLGAAWERYGLPLAVTEAHLGCTREEQLRWFLQVWEEAASLRRRGVDVRAVTAWSLLGAYDWNSLLTRRAGHYEPGVFDVRGPRPRPTALAGLLRDLAAERAPEHPVLAQPGWWRRPERILYPPVAYAPDLFDSHAPGGLAETALPGDTPTSHCDVSQAEAIPAGPRDRPLVITGATGTLGRAFARLCRERGLPCALLSRQEMDIADSAAVERVLADLDPWAVVNAAGYVRVDDAEREPDRCRRENTEGAAILAAACARRGIALLTFSSDLVFDGAHTAPYVESDDVAPLSVYGASKAAAEMRVLDLLPAALVIRTSAFFGPWDRYNAVITVLQGLGRGEAVCLPDDEIVSPTYVPDLVHAALDLLIDGESGCWHLANQGAVSWAELARRAATVAGLDPRRVTGCAGAELGRPARRPRYSALGSERGVLLPTLDDALARYVGDAEVEWQGRFVGGRLVSDLAG